MIDEDIRKALDVDPSPEFVARVRTRIADEPAPPTWRWSWGLVAIGALAVSIVLATVVSRPHEAKPVAEGLPPPYATAETAPPPPAVTAPRDAARQPAPATTPHTTARAAQTRESEPEILIDQREMRTLRRLIDGVRDGRIDLAAAQNSTSHASAALEPVADIVIPPLVIEPIAPVSGAEGVTRDQAR